MFNLWIFLLNRKGTSNLHDNTILLSDDTGNLDEYKVRERVSNSIPFAIRIIRGVARKFFDIFYEVKLTRLTYSLAIFTFLLFVNISQAAALTTPVNLPGSERVNATGAFTYSIPLLVPPGTANMLPVLSLHYSSQYGDGVLGLGWSLSLNGGTAISGMGPNKIAGGVERTRFDSGSGLESYPIRDVHNYASSELYHGLPLAIVRCPRTEATNGTHSGINYDSNDRFCLNGVQLISTSGTYGANNTEYRTELESFQKIISYGTAGNGPQYFKVWFGSGRVLEFGNTSDSRIEAVGISTVRAWAVNKITDSMGNYLTVTYTDDQTNGQAYPTQIDYTGNAGESLSTYNSVQFTYNTSRDDVLPKYQGGSIQKTTVLLTNIKTYEGANLVTDYKITYDEGATDLSSHSHITKIERCDNSANCLEPTEFVWQGEPDRSYEETHDENNYGVNELAAGDFNGDGLTDVLYIPTSPGNNDNCDGSTAKIDYGKEPVWIPGGVGSGPGYWDLFDTGSISIDHSETHCGTYFTPAQPGQITRLLDHNGDGLTDVIVKADGKEYYLVNDGAGTLEQAGSVIWSGGSEPEHAYADFNGDGRTDRIEYGATGGNDTTLLISDGDGTFTSSNLGTTLSGTAVRFYGDFDGDGCTDVLMQASGNSKIVYSCNPAVATLSVTQWVTHTPYYDYTIPSSGSNRLALGDFNGDGTTDIVVMNSSSTGTMYLSTGTALTSTAFSIPNDWSKYSVQTGDFNGDGMADIALIVNARLAGNGGYGNGTSHKYMLSTGVGFYEDWTVSTASGDFPGGGSRGVFAVIADWNHDGASDIWLQKPTGSAQLVGEFEPEAINSTSNGLTGSTDVTYDRLNKNGDFYNRGSAATYPAQDINGPLYVVSETGGQFGEEETGANYTYEGAQYEYSGRESLGFSTVEITDVQTNIVQTSSYRQDYPYVGLLSTYKRAHSGITLLEITNILNATNLGGSRRFVFLEESEVEEANDLDGTDMPTQTTELNYDSYGNPTEITISVSDGSSNITTNTYLNDTTHWYIGRLLTSEVRSIVGSSDLTRELSYDYDDDSGILIQEIIEPNDVNFKLQKDYDIDDFGNRTGVTISGDDIDTITSETEYDAKGRFSILVNNALNQEEDFTFDPAFGVVTSHTDVNNQTTDFDYDGFGRLIQKTRSDGNKLKTAYVAYGGGWVLNTVYRIATTLFASNGSTQLGPEMRSYFDAGGRALYDEREWTTGNFGHDHFRQTDANGRIAQEKLHPDTNTSIEWTNYTYDDLGRLTKIENIDDSDMDYEYHGLTTSVTNDLGQTTTTVKNAQGLIESVMDDDNETTEYEYDAFGNLIKITDSLANETTFDYNIRGFNTAMSSPDKGTWSYEYDQLGQLLEQTDSNGEVTTFEYDKLGRLEVRDDDDMTATYTWDSATNGVGKLASVTTGGNYTNSFTYDSVGRTTQARFTIDSNNYDYNYAYNTDGTLDWVQYPSGLKIDINRTSLGYATDYQENGSSTILEFSSLTHLIYPTYFNRPDVYVSYGFDTEMNRPTSVWAYKFDPWYYCNNIIYTMAGMNYDFDTIGNLEERENTVTGVVEEFDYDNLNRLTSYMVDSGSISPITRTVAYDEIGNITSKSNVGTYSYPSPTDPLPHAVSSITGTVNGVTNPTFAYDDVGNMETGAGRTLTYKAYNRVNTLVQGADTFTYSYGPENRRYKQVKSGSSSNTTLYINDPIAGMKEEVYTAGGTTTYRDYQMLDGRLVSSRFKVGASTYVWRYYVTDSLNSNIAILDDSSGSPTENLAYDAFGKRRQTTGADDTGGSITSAANMGYTGHEMMDDVDLINMNARIYDPYIGRFMQADPRLMNLYSPQALNLYSYVNNNPLNLTDPNGEIPTAIVGGIAGGIFGLGSYLLGSDKPNFAGGLAALGSGIAMGALMGTGIGVITRVAAVGGALNAAAQFVDAAGQKNDLKRYGDTPAKQIATVVTDVGKGAAAAAAAARGGPVLGRGIEKATAGLATNLMLKESTTSAAAASTTYAFIFNAGRFSSDAVGSFADQMMDEFQFDWDETSDNSGLLDSGLFGGGGVFEGAGGALSFILTRTWIVEMGKGERNPSVDRDILKAMARGDNIIYVNTQEEDDDTDDEEDWCIDVADCTN